METITFIVWMTKKQAICSIVDNGLVLCHTMGKHATRSKWALFAVFIGFHQVSYSISRVKLWCKYSGSSIENVQEKFKSDPKGMKVQDTLGNKAV